MMKVAFVGLGNMGLPMATNLTRAAAVELVAYDVAAVARDAARRGGLTVADELTAAVAGADAVITMLPAGENVRAVLAGDDGLFRLPGDVLFVDCSTTSPEDAKAMAAVSGGHRFMDAPVSGGIGAAKVGTLSFLVGGSDDLFAAAKPLLAGMGKNIFHAGGIGDGQAAKLCNNMLLSVLMIGTCEALALGEKLGLDAAVLSGIMSESSGGNWAVSKYNPAPGVMSGVPAANDYRGGFVVDLMLKDSNLAMAEVAANNAAAPLGQLANEIYRQHQANGNGKLDFSSIYNFIRRG